MPAGCLSPPGKDSSWPYPQTRNTAPTGFVRVEVRFPAVEADRKSKRREVRRQRPLTQAPQQAARGLLKRPALRVSGRFAGPEGGNDPGRESWTLTAEEEEAGRIIRFGMTEHWFLAAMLAVGLVEGLVAVCIGYRVFRMSEQTEGISAAIYLEVRRAQAALRRRRPGARLPRG